MELEFLIPDWSAPPNVRALVTTRRGGASRGPYASLNLADHVGDDPQAVAINRARLRAHLPADPVWLRQVHGTRCIDAAAATPGSEADAAYACRTGIVCAVLTADCLPILLCDHDGTRVAAIHAGWRGLAAGIIEETVATLGVPAASLLAWLGPAIGPGRFEVGAEVRTRFLASDAGAAEAFVPAGDGKWRADLYRLATRRLTALGVCRPAGGDFCTAGDAERFFSYRRDGVTGRMASLIWLD